MGHDTAIGFAASQGHFELNVYKPLIALDCLDSLRLLADAMDSFATHCVAGHAGRCRARADPAAGLADAGDRAGPAHRL
jgi:fumarate hydratase class II